MKRTLLPQVAAAACLWPLMGHVGHAQLVQVRPGYVKAPFVRVYHDADGGTYVRAPFVEIETLGRGRGLSATDEFCRMSWPALAQGIQDWAARLDADLDRMPSGEFWKSSLKIDELAPLAAADRKEPPAEQDRQRLREILDVHTSVARSPEVNRVARLSSFQMLHAALGEYTTPAEPRLRKQLLLATRDLNHALDEFNTAADWQRHLMLNRDQTLSDDLLAAAAPTPSPESLTKALAIFESVQRNEQYAPISKLRTFKATHEALAAYLKQLHTTSIPKPEELPLPKAAGNP